MAGQCWPPTESVEVPTSVNVVRVSAASATALRQTDTSSTMPGSAGGGSSHLTYDAQSTVEVRYGPAWAACPIVDDAACQASTMTPSARRRQSVYAPASSGPVTSCGHGAL